MMMKVPSWQPGSRVGNRARSIPAVALFIDMICSGGGRTVDGEAEESWAGPGQPSSCGKVKPALGCSSRLAGVK